MPETELDTTKLEEEVAKVAGEGTEEDTGSETTSEETSEKETSEDKSTRADTSLKTADETKEAEKEEENDEETRFDKHPRWQKLKQERDEASERASRYEQSHRAFEDIKQKLGDLETDEVTRFREVSKLLKKYPELAQKVEKLVDEYQYGNEEVKNEIGSLRQEQENVRQQLMLEKYDNTVDKLISDNKIEKEVEPLLREVLDNRVIGNKVALKDVPKLFEKTLKDLNIAIRKKLASHIETRKDEPRVPKTPETRDKVMTSRKESEDAEDIINELAEGLKATRSELPKE